MAAAAAFVKPPEEIQLSMGNPTYSWGKWKRRFEIYLQATGSSTQPGAQKVGLLLNHIGDTGTEIVANFKFDNSQSPEGFATCDRRGKALPKNKIGEEACTGYLQLSSISTANKL